jgi:spore coat polysaccharide biosynthesis predicted glycosyltransferase SpsG
VPAISDKFGWLKDLRRGFNSVHVGPEFLMIRSEIKRAKQLVLKEPPSSPQILVVLGGADPRGLTAVIGSALSEFASENRVVIVGSDDNAVSGGANLTTRGGVIYSPRSTFVEELARSTLVISAAGTTSGELLFLGIPSIFIPVVDNQVENAQALENLAFSSVLWPDSPDFGQRLVVMVGEVIAQRHSETLFDASYAEIDGFGAQRVASLLLG